MFMLFLLDLLLVPTHSWLLGISRDFLSRFPFHMHVPSFIFVQLRLILQVYGTVS